MALKDLGKLRPETNMARQVDAIVTEADVQELRARAAAINVSGEVLNEAGMIETTSAAKTRAMLGAEGVSSGIYGAFMDWLRGQVE